jgi:predicted dehydrogenase
MGRSYSIRHKGFSYEVSVVVNNLFVDRYQMMAKRTRVRHRTRGGTQHFATPTFDPRSTPMSHARPSRRTFVKSAALAAAAPMIVPASVLADAVRGGPTTTTAPSKRITLGFIGMGKQCGGHLGYMIGRTDVQVLAVCDVDATRREAAREKVAREYVKLERKGVTACTAYNDYREVLARKDIDAVVIATPEHWHAIPLIEAAKAKKDIYCEKPLTLTLHEGVQCIEAVRKHKVIFQTGSQQRSWKEFRQATAYVRAGRIGKVKTVTVGVGGPAKACDLPEEPMEAGLDWDRWLGPAPLRPYNSVLSPRGVHNHFPQWRQYREYAGGSLADIGAHHFDIAQWGLDMDRSGPVEIIPPEDEKAGKGCRFIYANGVEMTHGGPPGITFVGSEGTIYVTRKQTTSTPEALYQQPLTADDAKAFASYEHRLEWLDAVRSRKQPTCDVEVGARSVAICILANLAYEHRRKMKWDPAKWEFPGDAEANGWRDRARRGKYQLPEA